MSKESKQRRENFIGELRAMYKRIFLQTRADQKVKHEISMRAVRIHVSRLTAARPQDKSFFESAMFDFKCEVEKSVK